MSSNPLTTTPASLLAMVLRVSEPAVGQDRPRLCRLACVVSELEGIYPLSASHLLKLPQQLKPEIRRLFDGLVLRRSGFEATPDSDTVIPNHSSPPAESERMRVAILNPSALFTLLQEQSHHHPSAAPQTSPISPLLPV